MQEYIYTAKDKSGKLVKANVQASSPGEASKLLVSKGLFPVEIKAPSQVGLEARLNEFVENFRSVKGKDKVIFTRQLATLVKAGLPIAKALEVLIEQMDNPKLHKVVQDISNNVQGGSTLAQAMGEHGDIFSNIYISMVESGELSGNLDETLLRLADQEEKTQAIRTKVRSTLTYPVVVLAVLIGVSVLMITLVIPQVANMYKELGQPLPVFTGIMLGIANFLRRFWYLVLVFVGGSGYWARWYMKTDYGRAVYDRFKLNVPIFKTIVHKVYMARFTRIMSSLVVSGVSILQALDIASRSMGNVHLEASIKKVANRVKAGDPISKPVAQDPLFLPLVAQMLQVGEKTGSMGDTLTKVADYYEEEVTESMKNLATLIEPVAMLLLGSIVAFLMAAVLLPIYGLVSNVR